MIALAAILWVSSGSQVTHKLTTTTVRQANSTAVQQNGEKQSAQDLLSILSSYRQQKQFTANYSGSIYTSMSMGSGTVTGNVTSEFERYNDSARTNTTILSPQAGDLMTSNLLLRPTDLHVCTANSSQNYSCQGISTTSTPPTSGSPRSWRIPPNSSSKTLTLFNSSYRGIPCLGLSSRVNSSYNNSGVHHSNQAADLELHTPAYRIPLQLSINTTPLPREATSTAPGGRPCRR